MTGTIWDGVTAGSRGKHISPSMQRFARAFKKVFPNALCQWEDFSKQNAFEVRDAYLHDMISFNDDIQGTGAVCLAGILSAMKIKEVSLKEQAFLIYGAGAGGIGVAEQIETALVESGLSDTEARSRIFAFDRNGLVTSHCAEPYQRNFTKNPAALPWFRKKEDGSLINVIKNAGITILIGTSGQRGHFTKEVVQAVQANTERPVIMPLSNPTEYSEAVPSDIFQWTAGRALVATGSPFDPVSHDGSAVRIGQMQQRPSSSPALVLGFLPPGPGRYYLNFLLRLLTQYQSVYLPGTFNREFLCHLLNRCAT